VLLLLFCFFLFLHQIDKQLDAVFSKGKPHIKKVAPVGGEQIKGEQQGRNRRLIFGKLLWQPDKVLVGVTLR